MDDDDDDDYFLYALRFHLPACIRGSLKKSFVCWVRAEWMYVCSVALGVGMVAHHHVFFPYMFSREDVHRDDLREREKEKLFDANFLCRYLPTYLTYLHPGVCLVLYSTQTEPNCFLSIQSALHIDIPQTAQTSPYQPIPAHTSLAHLLRLTFSVSYTSSFVIIYTG